MENSNVMFYKFDAYQKTQRKFRDTKRNSKRDKRQKFSVLTKFKRLNRSLNAGENERKFKLQFETFDEINKTFEDLCTEYREENFDQYVKQAQVFQYREMKEYKQKKLQEMKEKLNE